MKRKTITNLLYFLLSLLLGLLAGYLYFLHFLQQIALSNLKTWLILIYLITFYSTLGYFAIKKIIVPHLKFYLPHQQLLWISGCLLAGIWLTFAIPLPLPTPPASPHSLEIIATGKKNPLSQGSEVWVTGLFLSNGDQVLISEFTLNGDWEIREGVPLSYKNQPAHLYWQGKSSSSLHLVLLSHPWSGKIKLLWDGQEDVIDLYSNTDENKEIILELKPPKKPWYFSLLIYGGSGLWIGMVLLIVMLFLVGDYKNFSTDHASIL